MPDGLQLPQNIDVVHRLLQDEAQGTLPEAFKEHIARARSEGWMPPPLLGPTNPSGMKTPQITPQPTEPHQGWGDWLMGSIPDAYEAVKSTAKSFLQPEVLAPTAAGMLVKSAPGGILAAGAAGGAVAAGRELYRRSTDPQAMQEPLSNVAAKIGTGMLSGAVGETVGRGISAVPSAFRSQVTPAGEAAAQYFGRDAMMPQQLTDSPALGFAANVARYGPGGSKIIRGAEQAQSDIAAANLTKTAVSHSPTGAVSSIPPAPGATAEFNPGVAGQQLQRANKLELVNARKTSGYRDFMKDFGQSREADPLTGEATGSPVKALQKQRSDALAASRAADASGDAQAKFNYDEQARKLTERIHRALPDQAARDEYTAMSTRYGNEMARVDNPTAYKMRTGKSDDVIDSILDSKLKNYASTRTGGTGQTNAQLVGRIKAAVSPEAFGQLQTDTIYRMMQRSLDKETGQIDADAFEKMLKGLDSPTQEVLFGKSAPEIHKTLAALKQAQAYTKSEAGRIFVDIQTGGAGVRLLKAGLAPVAGAALGGAAGQREGHPYAGAAAGATMILVSPYVIAKALTSPVGRELLTRAAAPSTSAKVAGQAGRALTRWAAQRYISGSEPEANQEPQGSPADLTSIPEPPSSTTP